MNHLTVFIILATILLLALSGCKGTHTRVTVFDHYTHYVGCIHHRPVIVHRPVIIHRSVAVHKPRPSIIIQSRISHGRSNFGRGVRGRKQSHSRSVGRSLR